MNETAPGQSRFVAISGCSGAGKSALLDELGLRGFATVSEPGRQIVQEQQAGGGHALPDRDFRAFVELCVSRTIGHMRAAVASESTVFFDRGIIDAISYLDYRGVPVLKHLREAAERYRYDRTVFIVPPWPEIFRNDPERKHSFEDAQAQYAVLLKTYERFGYSYTTVPKASVTERADFVLHAVEGC